MPRAGTVDWHDRQGPVNGKHVAVHLEAHWGSDLKGALVHEATGQCSLSPLLLPDDRSLIRGVVLDTVLVAILINGLRLLSWLELLLRAGPCASRTRHVRRWPGLCWEPGAVQGGVGVFGAVQPQF